MEKNMRMKFLKQRITVILLLVASVCICGSINEFYVFEELPIYAILKRRQIKKMNWC